jgi:Surface antigen variable number repeat
MRILVRLIVAWFLLQAGLVQAGFAESANNVRIAKLVIQSTTLPNADRKQIIRIFEQNTYPEREIGERIRGAFRDIEYLRAIVDQPKLSFPAQIEGNRSANITVRVDPGAQYRLGEIHFEKATIFPSARLADLFLLRRGDLFSVTKIGDGLESLRILYGTDGYINTVATPTLSIDESRRIISLVIFVDEERPYNFGKLYLEGIEPNAGTAKALLNYWSSLEGRRYNPVALQSWLLANHIKWKVDGSDSGLMRITPDSESFVVNVRLTPA